MQTPLIETQVKTPNILYEKDFYLWLETTAKLLKEKRFLELDLENLIEEIETMGRSEKYSLKSNLRIILMHLLKYKYQPEKRTRSWLLTIFEHRKRIIDRLEESPSLKHFYQEIFDKCYENARKEASLETGLNIKIFPTKSPFTFEETLDSEYLPE